ncbi:hypothetical protein ASPVEDRAFT_154479 [Aspergillus versicolor CBS 583.65]|uniref:Major facilitator superfamily (MFS) profile domain-containing protein n=1 Tax=Aspergillus versicolor CBS 583.65 TaxID=1036611 RepID=A0A1L9PY13_ASPVE|nr:uncharacterized protein ASPVEDRAFT_154479 [Aspergillus versicolor CBS 583.65]OJJ06439.1 hypothetical protein ASPVEDRAFT_154479 [Aspergillus versicolor CBS 583.65]
MTASAPGGHTRRLFHNPILLINCVVCSIAFFCYGYDGSVISGVLENPPFQRTMTSSGSLSAGQLSVITSVPVVGVILGLPPLVFFADRFGRPKIMLVSCVIVAVGSAVQTAGFNIPTMVVGRAIAYAGIYTLLVLSPVLLAELSPPEIRGRVVSLSIVLINVASVVSAGVNWAYSTTPSDVAFRVPLGLQCVFPVLIGLGLYFVHESPTFHLINSQNDKALCSLRRLRKPFSGTEIQTEFEMLQMQSSLAKQDAEIPWKELFKGTNLRRTLLSLSIPNFQMLSGNLFATNYATVFLSQINSSTDPFLLVLALNILALGGAVTGLFLVDLVGRRTLALTTFVVLFLINLSVGVLGLYNNGTNEQISKAIAAFCLMFGFFFGSGFGPLAYVVPSEFPTARLRNKCTALTFMTVAVFSLVVALVLPYISQPDSGNLGAKTYLLFAGWMLMCIIVTFFWFPEVKGRSPAEIDHMFEAKVPARKFKTYVCPIEAATTASLEKDEKEEKEGTGVSHMDYA